MLKLAYQAFAKPLFFTFDPEFVHDRISDIGKLLGSFSFTRFLTRSLFYYQNPKLTQTITGLTFVNPVGLSAGFDKNADLLQIIPEVGFGFMSIGTVTLHEYQGNPKPRLVRLPHSKSILVNYGLKNIGVTQIIRKLKNYQTPKQFVYGLSIGKTNSPDTCTIGTGLADYSDCLQEAIASGIGNYYEINISCPNTFGGEPFTTPQKLEKLLKKLMPIVGNDKKSKPVLLKMPINIPWSDFKKMCEIAITYKVAGVIIGNLNKDRTYISDNDSLLPDVKGNASGKPCWELSNELISQTYKTFGRKLVIIGVGGIFSGADAYEKIRRGASLVQLITGLIYEGPQLIGEINRDLVKFLERDGYFHISEAVGSYHSRK